jgi:hypothetical protein
VVVHRELAEWLGSGRTEKWKTMQGKVCFSKFNKLLDGTINLTQTSEKTRGQKLRKLFLSKPTESMVTNGSASHCVWKAGKFAIFLISYRTDNQVKNHFYSQLR